MKVVIEGKVTENSYVMGYVELADLSAKQRDALRLRESEPIDALNCIIYFDIDIEDARKHQAVVILDSVRVLSPVDGVSLDVDASEVSNEQAICDKLHDKIDWGQLWEDTASESDMWYDAIKDRLSEVEA